MLVIVSPYSPSCFLISFVAYVIVGAPINTNSSEKTFSCLTYSTSATVVTIFLRTLRIYAHTLNRHTAQKVLVCVVLGRLRETTDCHAVSFIERLDDLEEVTHKALGTGVVHHAVCDEYELVVFVTVALLRLVVLAMDCSPCLRIAYDQIASVVGDSFVKNRAVAVVLNVEQVKLREVVRMVGDGCGNHFFVPTFVYFFLLSD